MLPYPMPVSVIVEWFKEVWSCFTKMYKWTYLTVVCFTRKHWCMLLTLMQKDWIGYVYKHILIIWWKNLIDHFLSLFPFGVYYIYSSICWFESLFENHRLNPPSIVGIIRAVLKSIIGLCPSWIWISYILSLAI